MLKNFRGRKSGQAMAGPPTTALDVQYTDVGAELLSTVHDQSTGRLEVIIQLQTYHVKS